VSRPLVVLALAASVIAARPAAAKGCHEKSHVVGHERCSRFGEWSRDQPILPLWVDVGFMRHSFQSQPVMLAAPA
jgi:hypothetical protein